MSDVVFGTIDREFLNGHCDARETALVGPGGRLDKEADR